MLLNVNATLPLIKANAIIDEVLLALEVLFVDMLLLAIAVPNPPLEICRDCLVAIRAIGRANIFLDDKVDRDGSSEDLS